MDLENEEEKFVIPINNLNEALSFADQDLKTRWEFYKERFLKKGKKK